MDRPVSTHLETPMEGCIVVKTCISDSDGESDITEDILSGGVNLEIAAAPALTGPRTPTRLRKRSGARGVGRSERHERLGLQFPERQNVSIYSADVHAPRARAPATSIGPRSLEATGSESRPDLAVLNAEHSVRLSRVAMQPTVSAGEARHATKTVNTVRTMHAGAQQDVAAFGPGRTRRGRIKFVRAGLAAAGRNPESGHAEGPDIARFYQERAVMETQIRSKDALIQRQAAYIEKLQEVRDRVEKQLAAASERTTSPPS
ncbi:hypothetical protein N657DRAFT_632050 [Parathielavia appendiculata]|uniref:Uncharacterized protein n=1 Tax=Parathielavia appendiculata TaxID=2587402 RepID=A0AAN6Z5J1_9PEZI|nr:hypothetical protein N657DRAFT_632050 [Parathielavia appendiculata]